MSNNAEHNALVQAALHELAINHITAWRNETGVWFEHDEEAEDKKGRPHRFGKTGAGDIIIILPVMVQFCSGVKRLVGWHVEAEAKTGEGRQRKNQKLHQEFCVERNGGAYFVFRSVLELMKYVNDLKSI